jgi:hypothetical protein
MEPDVTQEQGTETEEILRLRTRVAELEAELVDVQAHANDAVAEWQDRAYWLDRWHLDLNALMQHPAADRVRAFARALRSPVRMLQKALRGVRS